MKILILALTNTIGDLKYAFLADSGIIVDIRCIPLFARV